MGLGRLLDGVRSAVEHFRSPPQRYEKIIGDSNRVIFSKTFEEDGALISKDSKIKHRWRHLREGVSAAESKVLEKLDSMLHISTGRH